MSELAGTNVTIERDELGMPTRLLYSTNRIAPQSDMTFSCGFWLRVFGKPLCDVCKVKAEKGEELPADCPTVVVLDMGIKY